MDLGNGEMAAHSFHAMDTHPNARNAPNNYMSTPTSGKGANHRVENGCLNFTLPTYIFGAYTEVGFLLSMKHSVLDIDQGI